MNEAQGTKNPILVAIELLDTANDDHWTTSGEPRVDVLQALTGLKDLKRSDIISVAPEFSRFSLQQPEVVAEQPSRDSARERLAQLDQEVKALKAEINEATKRLAAMVKEQDKLIQQMDPGVPGHMQNQRNIMDFLEGQARQRKERHAQRAAIFKGIDPRSLDPRAPLDQAFARKNLRGTTRPGAAAPPAGKQS